MPVPANVVVFGWRNGVIVEEHFIVPAHATLTWLFDHLAWPIGTYAEAMTRVLAVESWVDPRQATRGLLERIGRLPRRDNALHQVLRRGEHRAMIPFKDVTLTGLLSSTGQLPPPWMTAFVVVVVVHPRSGVDEFRVIAGPHETIDQFMLEMEQMYLSFWQTHHVLGVDLYRLAHKVHADPTEPYFVLADSWTNV